MTRSIFDGIQPIAFEGQQSTNPLAYRYYDAGRLVLGKTMAEHLRLAVCYWHSFAWDGRDIFGTGTFNRPWHATGAGQLQAEHKLAEAFAFMSRLGLPWFTFHDVDVMAPAETVAEHVDNLARIADPLEARMEETGIGLLWGTANLFSHPRYMAGGATNPDPDVFRFAAVQVNECMALTKRLGGENYVLWGGREGYDCLLNTDLAQEKRQLARFLSLVVEHKHKIGFKGTILIEPKPHEPTKHQYDYDVETIYGFLLQHGLEKEVAVNIEANHATLSGHSFEHEVASALALGIFGSLDMNRGDPQNGWDTDQFPVDLREIATVLYYILSAGGFARGGINFDAKVRRQSIDAEDLFHAHVGGVDLVARALLCAASLLEQDDLAAMRRQRYAGWQGAGAQDMLAGRLTLAEIAQQALQDDVSPVPRSGRQELAENILSRAIG